MTPATGYTALARVLAAVTASLADLKCKLMSTAVTPVADSLIADFVEADFDGYTPGGVAVADTGAIYLDGLGNVVWEAAQLTWQPTGTVTPNVIYGWWLEGTVGGTGARFVTGALFDAPVTMSGPLDFLAVRPQICLGQPR